MKRHKAVEHAREEAEQRYRHLVDASVVGVFSTRANGEIDLVNPAMAHLVGFDSPQQMLEEVESAAQLYENPDSRNVFLEELRRTGEVRDFETELLRRDGSCIDVSLSARPELAADGSLVRLHGLAVDISERKRREDERHILASIVDSHVDGIWSVDLNGAILSWNPGAEKMLLFEEHEMKGASFSSLLAEGERDLRYVFDDVRRGESRRDVECKLQSKDGAILDVSLTVSPVRRPAGGIVGMAMICRDIRHRKNNEALRRNLEEKVRQTQKMEAIGQLAGGVAHDFNNLLSVIQNFTYFALESLPSDSSAREDLQEVIGAAERGARLTRQLLTFGRRDAARRSSISLNDVITAIEKMLRATMRENISFLTVLADDLWDVEADIGQMEQVLMNLAINASDAMPHGGRFEIVTSNVVVGEEMAESKPRLRTGEYVRLTVSDTGAGIDRDVQKRVFEPFFTTKRVGEGTGLGLATTYAIVTQAGGEISLYSEPGHGTTFKIYLPPANTPSASREAISEPTTELGRGESILVVEDEAPVAAMVERVLNNGGYRACVAATPEEAVRLVETEHIDLIISDVIMPGLSGKELRDRMKMHAPTVFMSGYTGGIVASQGIADAFFIQKPFSATELLGVVRKALDHHLDTSRP